MSTPTAGAGFAPAGFSVAGFGSPATVDGPTGVVFADPTTGLPLTCRRIDPATGQYVYGANGLPLGMTTAQQCMLLAIGTVLGSAADGTVGQTFTQIQDVTPDLQRQVEDIVARATASIVSQQIAVVNRVVVDPTAPDKERVRIYWTDLTTGLEQQTP